MKIIRETLTLDELNKMASGLFGSLVKAVVDVEKEIIAVDAPLHADLEALLLQDGSKQKNLWGINFYPEISGDDFVEFDSMINLRPTEKNMSRGVDNPQIRMKILEIVQKRIHK